MRARTPEQELNLARERMHEFSLWDAYEIVDVYPHLLTKTASTKEQFQLRKDAATTLAYAAAVNELYRAVASDFEFSEEVTRRFPDGSDEREAFDRVLKAGAYPRAFAELAIDAHDEAHSKRRLKGRLKGGRTRRIRKGLTPRNIEAIARRSQRVARELAQVRTELETRDIPHRFRHYSLPEQLLEEAADFEALSVWFNSRRDSKFKAAFALLDHVRSTTGGPMHDAVEDLLGYERGTLAVEESRARKRRPRQRVRNEVHLLELIRPRRP